MALIDPVILKARLADAVGRFDVDALDICDSTSSEAMRRADRGAPSGTVIVADTQTAGRGRRGREWLSVPEASLTFSLIWRFQGGATRLSGLSLAVGVAIARGLKQQGVRDVALKWPNDVLLHTAAGFAKLAGILIELSSDRRGAVAVIGVGLNLLAPTAPLPQPAAGIEQVLATVPDRHDVLAAILVELAVVLDSFAVNGFFGQKSEWLQYHAWQDREVRILGEGETPITGICRGVGDDGSLLIETAGGLKPILSGDVSLRCV